MEREAGPSKQGEASSPAYALIAAAWLSLTLGHNHNKSFPVGRGRPCRQRGVENFADSSQGDAELSLRAMTHSTQETTLASLSLSLPFPFLISKNFVWVGDVESRIS